MYVLHRHSTVPTHSFLNRQMPSFLPDEYTFKARWVPGFAVLVPVAVFLAGLPIKGFVQDILTTFVIRTSCLVAVMFLLEVLIRRTSKRWIEDVLFNHELSLPTTEFLLYGNAVLSKEMKASIREKAEAEFDIKFPTAHAERKNETLARKRIAEAVRLIRNSVGRGRRTHDYNIIYGFWRNLLGAAVIASVMATGFAALAFFVFHIRWMGWTELVLATLSVVILLFRRPLLCGPAEEYAKCLLTEYAATKTERPTP